VTPEDDQVSIDGKELLSNWIQRCRNQRQATLPGCYDFMSAKNQRKAFALVTAAAPSWSSP
jgi:hypothetical protein